MLQPNARLEAFEQAQRRLPADHARHLKIFEALYREACALGIFPLADPLDGIEVDIRRAKALHVRTASGTDCAGAR